MEVYVDDMLVKSAVENDHLADLREAFDLMRKYQMKLNSEKYAFRVSAGKFLGFMVGQRGIEANPEKIKALIEIKSPTTLKDVQHLAGRITSLNRFISRASDKCLPFFKLLRATAKADWVWTLQCEKAFQQLKQYMSAPPILSKPVAHEQLLLYLSVSSTAVSAALIREDSGVQRPVYYISRAMVDSETRYFDMEKLALVLVTAARKLRPYFQAHAILVPTNHPLRQVLQRPKVSGRLTKWAIEISEHDISFCPRTAIKGQAVADFIAEFTYSHSDNDPATSDQTTWSLFVDGS